MKTQAARRTAWRIRLGVAVGMAFGALSLYYALTQRDGSAILYGSLGLGVWLLTARIPR